MRSELDGAFTRFKGIPAEQIETQSEYARYLLVRLCGFLEYGLEQLATEYFESNSGGPTKSFALSFSGNVGNPNSENICQFVGRFDGTWRHELEEFLGDEERKTSLNALVGLRHLVSHGRPSNVSYVTVMGYLKVVDELFGWILEKVDPL